MDRREALKTSTLLLGYALSASAVAGVLAGCKADGTVRTSGELKWSPTFFKSDQIDTIAEIAETILPRTETPGAKDVYAHQFIDAMLANHYQPDEQNHFLKGFQDFNDRCQASFGDTFLSADRDARHTLLSAYEEEMKQWQAPVNSEHKIRPFYRTIKELTVLGFFTSEKIGEEFLSYDPIPGNYEPCVPVDEIGPAWSL